MPASKARKVINSIKPKRVLIKGKPIPLGQVGYDNKRDDIEKVKKVRELVCVKSTHKKINIDNEGDSIISPTHGLNFIHVGGSRRGMISSNDNIVFLMDDTRVTSNVDIIPNVSDVRDLGATSQKWKDLHLSGDAFASGMLIDKEQAAVTKLEIKNTSNSTSARARIVLTNDAGSVNCPNLTPPTHGSLPNTLVFSNDITNGDIDFRTQNAGGTHVHIFCDSSAESVILNPTAGNAGVGTTTPSTKFSVVEKSGMTPIGGFAIKLTNETGGNTVAGQLVEVYVATAIDDAFVTAGADSQEVIGIVLDAGVAEHAEAWVVVSGIADVLMDGGGSARSDRIISSNTAGSADVWNVGGAVATHFQEIGHCIETRVGAGLARCVLHFN